ncbi:MAG TPA: hypothetical protein VJ782_04030 [Aeromicrobium sp.]|nr:hypothetical protein [Aeromicrobium sp.]
MPNAWSALKKQALCVESTEVAMAVKTTHVGQESAVNASAPETQLPVTAKEPPKDDELDDDDEDVYENFPGWNPTRW